MTIQTIIKRAIKRLELENKVMTPDFYAEAFCKEASKAGISTEDCTHVEKFTKTLNKDFQKQLSEYRIKSMQELTRFLISKLNRTSPTQCAEALEAQNTLTKRILQVVEVLHNKEASDLARKSIDLLESSPAPEQMNQFRQLWTNFITTYDDSFLKKLDALGDVDLKNLKTTIENLNISGSAGALVDNVDLSKISSLLIASLVPSIASSVNDQIADVSDRIRKTPSLLESTSVAQEIKSAISLRIALDKDSVKEMVESIDGVLDKLSLRLIDLIERSDSSTVEIQKIKAELDSYNSEDKTNFKIAHKKLYTIAVALEQNTQLLSKDLKDHSGEVNKLSKKVKRLEKELEEARQESQQDFLTKVYNRRALDGFLNIKEAEYKRHGHNYSVVLLDIDFFKRVNDDYGHDAGDAVLVAFAKILKQEAREVDTVGRFGGEEFIAILGDTDTGGATSFAQKVRAHVKKAKFMYKGQRIEITVSAGVAQRKDHISLNDVVKSADQLLYKSKENGRDQVSFK